MIAKYISLGNESDSHLLCLRWKVLMVITSKYFYSNNKFSYSYSIAFGFELLGWFKWKIQVNILFNFKILLSIFIYILELFGKFRWFSQVNIFTQMNMKFYKVMVFLVLHQWMHHWCCKYLISLFKQFNQHLRTTAARLTMKTW